MPRTLLNHDMPHAPTMLDSLAKKLKMLMIYMYLPQNLGKLPVVSNRRVDLICYPCFGLRFPWSEDDTFVGDQVQVCGTNLEPP